MLEVLFLVLRGFAFIMVYYINYIFCFLFYVLIYYYYVFIIYLRFYLFIYFGYKSKKIKYPAVKEIFFRKVTS